jgi:outer membrane protein assembly factor BamB
MVWHYSEFDQNGDKKVDFTETMHRTCGNGIKNDLLFIADFSGLFHCLDAKTGKPYWTHDLFAACWASALIVEDKVFIGDEEGKITIFRLAPKKEILAEINLGNSVYTTPVVANNVLYIANKTHLFAIQAD